ncbi:MAG: hypothetical protein ACI857_003374, partial [Arenicella sp.]
NPFPKRKNLDQQIREINKKYSSAKNFCFFGIGVVIASFFLSIFKSFSGRANKSGFNFEFISGAGIIVGILIITISSILWSIYAKQKREVEISHPSKTNNRKNVNHKTKQSPEALKDQQEDLEIY